MQSLKSYSSVFDYQRNWKFIFKKKNFGLIAMEILEIHYWLLFIKVWLSK